MAHSHVDEAWLPFWEEWGLGTSVVSFFFATFSFIRRARFWNIGRMSVV